MNWQEIEAEIKKLQVKINVRPDVIVAIAKGGLVPARLLAKFLKIEDIYVLNVKKVGTKRRVTTSIKEDMSDKAALLVEDVLESGESLAIAKTYLASITAKVYNATLYTTPATRMQPDYFLTKKGRLPYFPWE